MIFWWELLIQDKMIFINQRKIILNILQYFNYELQDIKYKGLPMGKLTIVTIQNKYYKNILTTNKQKITVISWFITLNQRCPLTFSWESEYLIWNSKRWWYLSFGGQEDDQKKRFPSFSGFQRKISNFSIYIFG